MQIDNTLKVVNEQLVYITLNIYKRLHELNASRALLETNTQIDGLISLKVCTGKEFEILHEISDKCFDFWAPLCEDVILTYREIQNYILPLLLQLLSAENLIKVENLVKESGLIVYDFNTLNHLPDPEFDKMMADLKEKYNSDFDDLDDLEDKNEESIYEDGPYCSACQEAPCMCSDPERTSTVWW